MRFNPSNPIVRLCIEAMGLEEGGRLPEARALFLRAFDEASDDHERLLAAYHVARQQTQEADTLRWLQTAVELARQVDDASVQAAFPLLYARIAECLTRLGDAEAAARHRDLAAELAQEPADRGPFYHGTRADLGIGALLLPGNHSNYQSDLVMNHIYFTALADGAGLAAALARGEAPERVYIVEPTASFEDDPNVTNKRFPGNPTRSYRSQGPLKVVGELSDWERPAPEVLARWRQRLADSEAEIIN